MLLGHVWCVAAIHGPSGDSCSRGMIMAVKMFFYLGIHSVGKGGLLGQCNVLCRLVTPLMMLGRTYVPESTATMSDAVMSFRNIRISLIISLCSLQIEL